jgi:hypothetical protein
MTTLLGHIYDLFSIFDLERGYHRLDCLLARLAECLGSDFSSLPAFVLGYRVLKASSYSRVAWIRTVSFLRSLKVRSH